MFDDNRQSRKPDYSLVWQVAIYLLAAAFYVGLSYGAFETKSHAADTFLSKESFKQHQDDQRDAVNEIRQALRDINRKLDERRK
jgi:hypothetical protein